MKTIQETSTLQLFAEGADTGETGAVAAPETDNTAAAQTQTDANAEFEDLIKGKYKAAFDARMQETIKGRLKNVKQAELQLQAAQPVLQHLAEKYGVEPGDYEALSKAVAGDQARSQEQGPGKLYDTWLQQEQETKTLYPAFSMDEALRDPKFRALLRGGADVRTAYEAVNVQRIIPAAMAVAARVVEEKLARSIASTAARPDENAALSRAASLTKTDVAKLSRADMEDFSRRVARGERISFG